MRLSRRTLVAGAALAPVVAFGAGTLAARCVAAIRAALAALPPGPVLLNSYITDDGPNPAAFDLTQANAAYVYDNALAGLALAAAGYPDDARRIGDALAIAQDHDRFWRDGRLRNAYQAGAMTAPAKLPGFWDKTAGRWAEDPYQAGSQTGPVAWAMLLWAALGQSAPADRAGSWLDDQLRAPDGYYGGFYGFEPRPLKLLWQSTEQNTDLAVAFAKLGRAEDANQARRFVASMFDPVAGQFYAGTAPDGAANHLIAADAGIWPYLAGFSNAGPALQTIKALSRGAGIGFSAASDGIWLEGTAFAAFALRQAGERDAAADFETTLAREVSPSGYLYATVNPELSTGLTTGPALVPGAAPAPFNYYRRPSLSATAWTALALLGKNPLAH